MITENKFLKETDGIYRLKVPFEDLYTSVFLICSEGGNMLVDCATTSRDADEYIEPALGSLGMTFSDIDCVIVTHLHGDHAGGLGRILQKEPKIHVVRTVEELNGAEIYPMCGHTKDFIGVLSLPTGTLISGDGLQGAGVGKYRCSLESKEGYLRTIERIERDKRIENILFSHAYEPWNRDGAFGRENVEKILRDCKSIVI